MELETSLLDAKYWQNHVEIVKFCEKIIDKSEQFNDEIVNDAISLFNKFNNNDNKIALKSGMYFELFDKGDVPFLNELKKKEYDVILSGNIFEVFDATKWSDVQKIDKLFANTYGNIMGFDINDYRSDYFSEMELSS